MLLLLIVLVLAGGAVAYVRSREGDAPSAAELAERQRTCARLITFSSLLGDPSRFPSPPGTVRPDAVANLVTTMGSDLDRLAGSAPGNVRDDVGVLVGAVRAQPPDLGVIRAPAFGQARQRLAAYLNDPRNGCQPGRESGDG